VKKTISIFLLLAFLLAGRAASAERPNILWITCEDISPYLGCYGCPEAYTPNLDQLASQGVRYTHAYANAPVCAVARSTLLTGMYATTIGTHQMRCRVQLPPMIPAYPRILRQAGYYCTNNRKKDYNSNYENDPSLWDESSGKAHYQNRRAGQPFFAVFNITVTHESQLSPERIKGYVARQQIPSRPRIDPQQIELPPYHPDLPAVRQDWARYDDLITLMDRMVGQRLRELEESGLAEETIVLFCSDHGGETLHLQRGHPGAADHSISAQMATPGPCTAGQCGGPAGQLRGHSQDPAFDLRRTGTQADAGPHFSRSRGRTCSAICASFPGSDGRTL